MVEREGKKMSVVYRQSQLKLAKGTTVPRDFVQVLQRDLLRQGYLRGALDAMFGAETERDVRALQWDLLFNDGRGVDGGALVPLRDFNRGRVAVVNGGRDEHNAKF